MATDHGSDRGAERPASAAPRSTSPIVVERITHEDVPAICSLYKRVWESEPPGVPTELIKSWQPTPLEFTSRMEGVTYFCARRDGRLLGVIGCELHHGSCQLVHLAVDVDARRQGVASALVTAGLEWTRRSNAAGAWTMGLDRFTAASALLKRLGFTEAGRLRKHDWGEDVRLFERIL